MTRSELREEVRFNLKRTSDALSDSRINTWLNWSLQFIADLHTYEEMRKVYTTTTTADQKSYSFPTRMKDIYTLRLISGASSRKLTYIYPREFDTKIPYPEQNSKRKSSYYVDYGTHFELYPIPDNSYTLELRCSLYPSSMSSDTDTPDLLRKDALIVAVATVFGFWSLREVEDASYWGGEIVPTLYQASLASDHSAEDWIPIARPYRTTTSTLQGEWWKNPFTGRRL